MPRLVIPSGGALRQPRRARLVAILSVRDGLQYLPGFVANVRPHVDGILALDDGSSDGSREFLAGRREVLELLRNPPERPTWDEMGNHRRLVAAALGHGADWAVVVDVDERLERDFRTRAERVIRRGRWLGRSSFAVRLRELWGVPDRYRADGIWGRKAPPRLFRLRADHVYDSARVHGVKTPLQDRPYPLADLLVYHLGMLTAERRERRRARYAALDPTCAWQPTGYDYLLDEGGLVLKPVPSRRRWVE